MKKIIVLFVCILSGCSPNPLTDKQVEIASEVCKKQGGIIKIFNNPAISQIECIIID